MIQEEHVEAATQTAEGGVDLGELLMDHAADHYALHFEPFPAITWDPHFLEFHLAGMTINMTPTKHLIYMVFAAALVFLVMWRAGKRLEKQRFPWPNRDKSDVLTMSGRELNWLLDGIDLFRIKPHQELSYKSVA